MYIYILQGFILSPWKVAINPVFIAARLTKLIRGSLQLHAALYEIRPIEKPDDIVLNFMKNLIMFTPLK